MCEVKRLSLLFVLVAALFFLLGGSALAVYGPHGGYTTDTDACAGCHRAHTAILSITWLDTGGATKNALLIGTNIAPLTSTSAILRDFCYTCHGTSAPGAATDVAGGIYDAVSPYGANSSTVGGVLNGGGFNALLGTGGGNNNSNPLTSNHGTMQDQANPIAWGGETTPPSYGETTGSIGGVRIANFNCASCHDPHGSSNYRSLKDTVNGVTVGGYLGNFLSDPNPTPNPWVVSNETNYPNGAGGRDLGFRLHIDYSASPYNYSPDYTTARYAQPVGLSVLKGISGWCAACHTLYNTTSSSGQGAYNAGDFAGWTYGYQLVNLAERHRHPVNQPLNTFKGDRALIAGSNPAAPGTNTPWGDLVDIPLEHDPFTDGMGSSASQDMTDFLGCLTCHRAHGTNKTMTRYANANYDAQGRPQPDTGGGGVPPTFNSALLRADNRGVCERCHNK